jgi:hypothetical protein
MSTLLARALEGANLDLLLLGALADKMRAAERGDVVRLHLEAPSDDAVTFDHADDAHSFLKKLAIARLSGHGPIRVDARAIGMQLAQVALTFGADEVIANVKTGLPVYGEGDVEVLRERELCGLIRAAGRIVRVVDRTGERDPDETTHAVRKFRAPGREARGEL